MKVILNSLSNIIDFLAMLCIELWFPSPPGFSQLSQWAAGMEKPCCAFLHLLCQPVQGLLAAKEQSRGGRRMVGDSKWAQHLHWVPAQQSVSPSHTKRQRGILWPLVFSHWLDYDWLPYIESFFSFSRCRCSSTRCWVCSILGLLSNRVLLLRAQSPAFVPALNFIMTLSSGEVQDTLLLPVSSKFETIVCLGS